MMSYARCFRMALSSLSFSNLKLLDFQFLMHNTIETPHGSNWVPYNAGTYFTSGAKMTATQNLWLTIFNFGPALILAIYKQWWVGPIALVATFILSWLLVFAVSMNLPLKAMTTWAWVKPPIIAALVLGIGWRIF